MGIEAVTDGIPQAKPAEKIDLSTTLVRLRHQYGLSQRKVARLSGVSDATIVHIESGWQTPNPGILTLTRIANAMGLSILEFIAQSLVEPEDPQSSPLT